MDAPNVLASETAGQRSKIRTQANDMDDAGWDCPIS
jgi:hypothetical protein